MLINKIWSSAICIPRLKEYVKEVIFRPVTRLWPGVKDIFTKKEFSDEEKKNNLFSLTFPRFSAYVVLLLQILWCDTGRCLSSTELLTEGK